MIALRTLPSVVTADAAAPGIPQSCPDLRPPQRPYFYLGDHVGMTTTVFGHKIFLDTRDISLAPHILQGGEWEMGVSLAIRALVTEGMTVVDIGANCGWFTLLMASLVGEKGHVHAFEPNPDLQAVLRRSVMVNGFWERTTLVPMGVMDSPGERVFHKPATLISGANFFYANAEYWGDRNESSTLMCTSLDAYFGALDDPRVDFLKIDAEGAEVAIIRGAHRLLVNNPQLKVILEWAPCNLPAAEYLVGSGYRMAAIEDNGAARPVSLAQLDSVRAAQMVLFVR